jgi:hypothetical protein
MTDAQEKKGSTMKPIKTDLNKFFMFFLAVDCYFRGQEPGFG